MKEKTCHCLTVFGQAVLFGRQKEKNTASPKTTKQWHLKMKSVEKYFTALPDGAYAHNDP